MSLQPGAAVVPLQNRVNPFGQLIAVEARGAWLGNRGILHDDQRQIVRPWKHRSWVTCRLEFKGRARQVFSPNRYSELFFLDEATALAAGHRPCAECRRDRFDEFKACWRAANPAAAVGSRRLSVAEIDKQLHMERALRGGGKATFPEELGKLPAGTFINLDGQSFLLWADGLHVWSPSGYIRASEPATPSQVVNVLTPFSVVRLFHQGFMPQVHESAASEPT